MAVHGFGSVSSPIVIDDDEEAYVEQQLNMPSMQIQHGGFATRYHQTAVAGPSNSSVADDNLAPGPVLGQKRKFHEMSPSRSNTAPQTATRKANVATARPNTSTDPQVESKTARKKRRKRERLAAEQAATQPLLAPSSVTPAVAQTPTSSNGPFARSESHRQNNTSSVMFPSVHAAPPPLNRHPLVIPGPYVPTLPPKPSALTTSIGQNLVSRPAAFLFPQAGPSKMTGASLSFARPELPTTPILDAASVPVTTPVPLPAIPSLPPIQKRTIGMPADTTTPIKHGLYAPVTRNFPAVNPTRALVMELLPRKFRNREFILSWAKGFSPRDTIRIDCNVGIGKALVQFSRAELAREAFEGPRLTGGEGREHIRVYWYRGDDLSSAPRPDLEEGEIQEDDTQDQQAEARPSKKKAKVKQKVVKKKVQSTPSLPPAPIAGPSQPQLPSSGWAGRLRSNTAPSSSPVFMRPSLFNGWPYVDKSTSFTIPPSANLDASTSHMEENKPWNGEREQSMDLETDDGYEPPQPPREISPIWPDVPRPIQATGGVASTDSPIWSDQRSIASSRPASPVQVSWSDTFLDRFEHDPGFAVAASDPEAFDVFRTDSPWQSDDGQGLLDTATAETRPNPMEMDATLSQNSPEAIHAPVPLPAQSGIASQLHDTTGATFSPSPQPSPSPSPPVVAVAPPVSTPTPTTTTSAVHRTTSEPSGKAANDTRLALFARAKELEERIARTKEELARKAAGSLTPANSTPSPVPQLAAAVEDDLRQSVLASRNKVPGSAKDLALPSPSPAVVHTSAEPVKELASPDCAISEHSFSTVPSSATSVLDDYSTSTSASNHSPKIAAADEAYVVTQTTTHTTASVIHSAASLDDMAISFITETIQTVKPPPPKAPSEKMQLAAKQKRLEQQIAESKILMAKLSSARTKGERDQIMVTLREQRRLMEEGMKADAITSQSPSSHTSMTSYSQTRQSVYRSSRMSWPETAHDAGIFTISDDEDGDDA